MDIVDFHLKDKEDQSKANFNSDLFDQFQRNNGFYFKCDCEEVLLTTQTLRQHLGKCQQADNHYTDIFEMFQKFQQESKLVQEKMNLSAILKILVDDLQSIIEEESLRVENMDEAVPNKLQNFMRQNNKERQSLSEQHADLEAFMHQEIEEIKGNIGKYQIEDYDLLDLEEEKIPILNYEYKRKPSKELAPEICKYCRMNFTEKEQARSEIIMIEQCLHRIHKKCFEQIALQAQIQMRDLQSPCCKQKISEYEIQNVWQEPSPQLKKTSSVEEREYIQQLMMGLNIVTCPCGVMMELEWGEIDIGQKDNFGNYLTQEAAIHFSQKRVRCYECTKIFCAECKTEPYHLGQTCEQFKEYQASSKCRYCLGQMKEMSQSPFPAFRDVCREPNCQQLLEQTCEKLLPCKHACCGFKDELECLPCLDQACVSQNQQLTLENDKDSYCTICFTEGLGQAPCVQLKCKHIFHLDCITNKVKQKWNGPRINFTFLECPQCKQQMEAPPDCTALDQVLKEGYKLLEQVKAKALERGKFEGLDKDERLLKIDDNYYNNFQAFALYKLSFYECFKCKQPFYGGMRDCGEEQNNQQNNQNFNPEELVCGLCASIGLGAGVGNCEKHGSDFIEFKCKYCCSMAIWFCWGTTHFCEPCHQVAGNNVVKPCEGPDKCALKGQHPLNGEEYPLGCAVCRDEFLGQNQNQNNI